MKENEIELKRGAVVQLNENTKNKHFIGSLAMVSEPKGFGAQIFVNCLDRGNAYYRASWEEMEYIGHAPMIPADDSLEE